MGTGNRQAEALFSPSAKTIIQACIIQTEFTQGPLQFLNPLRYQRAALRGLKLALDLSRFAFVAHTHCGCATVHSARSRTNAAAFPLCSWTMFSGEIIVLGHNPELGGHRHSELCRGDWGRWRHAQEFCSGTTRFLRFRQSE